MRDVFAGGGGRLHDGLTGGEGDFLGVEKKAVVHG
jgi:hypothetical protein